MIDEIGQGAQRKGWVTMETESGRANEVRYATDNDFPKQISALYTNAILIFESQIITSHLCDLIEFGHIIDHCN